MRELRAFGLTFPEAHTKSPWPGHLDLAVRDKTFAYLSTEGQPFSLSCKLPKSNLTALTMPHVEPAGYGLGKSGWVAASFPEHRLPPIEVLKSWIVESYRAQAPKRLVAQLDAAPPAPRSARNVSQAAAGGRNKAKPVAGGSRGDASKVSRAAAGGRNKAKPAPRGNRDAASTTRKATARRKTTKR